MTETLVRTFSALADDTRWKILSRLGEAPASGSTLAREFPISRQAIIKHLEVLRDAGLVDSEPRGREVVYHALGSELSTLARSLEAIGQTWQKRLGRIKELAESKGRPGGPDPEH